jgi:ubiquinone/menaquinone biosynthesis C-methylase UbiE
MKEFKKIKGSFIYKKTAKKEIKVTTQLFDDWTVRYDKWFQTPMGSLVKKYESALLKDLLNPCPREKILDAGCGTGIFTIDMIKSGPAITGVDISESMLQSAVRKCASYPFTAACGDLCCLPFPDESFDKVFSMTALEFIQDAAGAVAELERVTRKKGRIVLTTLNSLSLWADRRLEAAEKGHKLFQKVFFRSPDDMRALIPSNSLVKTAIHFQKQDPVEAAPEIERRGCAKKEDTGAFLAVQWVKI